MSRQRVSKFALGIELFPFLAVLICTMGGLIVLLVLVVRQASVRAETIAQQRAQDRQQQAAQQQDLKQAQEDLEWRQQLLSQQRQELTQRLADQRLELSHLEDHIRRIETRWKDLETQASELRKLRQGRQGDQAVAEADLARLQTEIEHERQRLEEARRQVERRRRSFAIIPYHGPQGTPRRPIYIECTSTGIVIQPEGIVFTPEDFSGPLGPGNPLDAALRAIREHWARAEGTTGKSEPYPLLIVRPDGAVAYSVARAAMSTWEDEFGYELVDAEMTLAYPPADPALKQLVATSIHTARQRQAILAAAMPSRFDRLPAPDHFPVPEWRSDGASALGGAGRGLGGSGSSGAAATGSRWGGAGSAGAGTTGLGAGGTGSASSNSARSGWAPGIAAGGRGAEVAGVPGGGGTGRSAPGIGPGGSGSDDREGSSAAGRAGANGGGSEAAGAGGQTPGAGNAPGGTSAVAGTPAAFGGGSGSGATPTVGAAVGAAGTPHAGSEAAATAPNNPLRDLSLSKPHAPPPRKRPDWALRNVPPRATAITRPISIECRPDQLVILPDRGTDGESQAIPVPEGIAQAIEPLVAAIWKHTERWGLAVAGGYWKPVLVVRVFPGAEARFEELKASLENSGLEVERKVERKQEPRRSRSYGGAMPS